MVKDVSAHSRSKTMRGARVTSDFDSRSDNVAQRFVTELCSGQALVCCGKEGIPELDAQPGHIVTVSTRAVERHRQARVSEEGIRWHRSHRDYEAEAVLPAARDLVDSASRARGGHCLREQEVDEHIH